MLCISAEVANRQKKKESHTQLFQIPQLHSYANPNQTKPETEPFELQITHATLTYHHSSNLPRDEQSRLSLVVNRNATTAAVLMLQGERAEVQQLLAQLGDVALQQRAQPVSVVIQLVDLLVVFLLAGADFGGGEAVVFEGAGCFGRCCCCWGSFCCCLVSVAFWTSSVSAMLLLECLLGLVLLRRVEAVVWDWGWGFLKWAAGCLLRFFGC